MQSLHPPSQRATITSTNSHFKRIVSSYKSVSQTITDSAGSSSPNCTSHRCRRVKRAWSRPIRRMAVQSLLVTSGKSKTTSTTSISSCRVRTHTTHDTKVSWDKAKHFQAPSTKREASRESSQLRCKLVELYLAKWIHRVIQLLSIKAEICRRQQTKCRLRRVQLISTSR